MSPHTSLFGEITYPMRYEFTLIDPDSGTEQQSWNLPLPVTVGRGMLCHISLDHGSISRKHCEFYAEDDGSLHVRDIGSKNGVFVAGSRVDRSAVEEDSIVRLGLLPVRIRCSHGDVSDASEPVASPKAAASDQDETHAVQILPTDRGRYEIG